MELRNHPVMFCDGVKVWPPKWLHAFGPGMRSVSGEVGVLDAIFLSHATIKKVCLLMTEGADCYLGMLMFENADSAMAVFQFLYKQINKPLTTIGAMNLPENLGKNEPRE